MKQLLLDLAGLTDENRIRATVSEFLSSFGEVTTLKIFDLPEHDSRIILITMNSQEAAIAAINHLGLLSFGERSLVITIPNAQA
ncbi:MAG TPA: RNA-binding protein [Gallionella sp.]|nr:RNA-binding protein [Gallionella sp.]